MDDAPGYIDTKRLQSINLNDYLEVNITYDADRSSSDKKDRLQQIPLFEGEVQYGEKIIDRGEIVDARLKNILDSYTNEAADKVSTKAKPGWLMLGELVMITIFIMALMVYLMFYRIEENTAIGKMSYSYCLWWVYSR